MRDRKVKELFRTKNRFSGIERIIDNQLFVLFFDQNLFLDRAKIVFSIKRWETRSLYIASISSYTLFLYNPHLFHFEINTRTCLSEP